jgi:hypothetical protein
VNRSIGDLKNPFWIIVLGFLEPRRKLTEILAIEQARWSIDRYNVRLLRACRELVPENCI